MSNRDNRAPVGAFLRSRRWGELFGGQDKSTLSLSSFPLLPYPVGRRNGHTHLPYLRRTKVTLCVVYPVRQMCSVCPYRRPRTCLSDRYRLNGGYATSCKHRHSRWRGQPTMREAGAWLVFHVQVAGKIPSGQNTLTFSHCVLWVRRPAPPQYPLPLLPAL